MFIVLTTESTEYTENKEEIIPCVSVLSVVDYDFYCPCLLFNH